MVKLWIIVVLIAVASASNLRTEQCIQEVRQIIEAIQKKEFNVLIPTALYSGKDLNDLGAYNQCKKLADYKYMILSLGAVGQNFSIGLCGPGYCTVEDYRQATPAIQDLLNKLAQGATKDPNTRVVVTFTDPDLDYTNFNWASVLAIAMVLFFVGGTVVGSAIDYFQEAAKEDKKAREATSRSDLEQSVATSAGINASIKESVVAPLNGREREQRDSQIIKFFKCFSLFSNFESLFSDREGGDQNINIFNGFRTISIIWVIWAHEYNLRGNLATNVTDLVPILQSNFSLVVLSALYAVDIFFFMGGFFFAYVFANKVAKMTLNAGSYFMVIVHRYIRLVPTYAFALFFFWRISIYFGSGPVWYKYVESARECDDMWYSNILLIDNYFGSFGKEYCFGHGWYMSNDFQIFLITPFLVWLYVKNPTKGKMVVWGLIAALLVYTYVLSDVKKFAINIPIPGARRDYLHDYFDLYYYKPWTRAPAYLYGLIFAFFYREAQAHLKSRGQPGAPTPNIAGIVAGAIKESPLFRAALYIVGFFTMFMIVWVIQPLLKNPNLWSQTTNDLYMTFSRIGFVMALSLVCICLMLDEGAWIRQLFLQKVFAVIGKISFSMYLIHQMVEDFTYYTAKKGFYFSHESLFVTLLSDLIMTMFLSMILHVVVELPMANIEKYFIFPQRPRTQAPKVSDEQKQQEAVKE